MNSEQNSDSEQVGQESEEVFNGTEKGFQTHTRVEDMNFDKTIIRLPLMINSVETTDPEAGSKIHLYKIKISIFTFEGTHELIPDDRLIYEKDSFQPSTNTIGTINKETNAESSGSKQIKDEDCWGDIVSSSICEISGSTNHTNNPNKTGPGDHVSAGICEISASICEISDSTNHTNNPNKTDSDDHIRQFRKLS
ncbi:unnamed protein product [Didymodactylos carnosus]|uniref:Uncharacterized protein n=1 Tax=Didymodactylos carnosus TaxID=1234261 RepID=A0A8S2DIF9_9BILA|nr:unnamed protein product [Didymodactylos carnosus]CAF3691802.1 unnamed protein product [Didymodactylos carnosus]